MSGGAPGENGGRDPLALTEQAAVAEELLSGIRHDLRNRLATVRNAVYYIQRKLKGSDVLEKDPRIAQFLDTIDSEMVASDGTLSEGRASARIVGARAERAGAPECVAQAVMYSRIRGAGIRIETAVEPGEVMIDPRELAVVVRCMIENAAEAVPDGGVVMVRGGSRGALFSIEVTDEGIGLAGCAEDAPFQAFFTTKAGHAGLGLSIASRIARRAAGEVRLRAEARGTVATLLLPKAP